MQRIGIGEQRYGHHRLGPVDADIGGPQPLADHRGGRLRMVADPAETAGHDGPSSFAVARGKDTQGKGTWLQPVADHDGHGRQAHHFLPDIVLRTPGHVGEQDRALLRRQARPRSRTLRQAQRPGTEGGADQQIVQMLRDMGRLRRPAAPPGRDVGQLERFARQMPGQHRQEGGEGRAFQHACARGIGDHHLSVDIGVDQAGDADLRMAVERERIEHPGIEPPPQRVDPLQPRDGADIDLPFNRREVGASTSNRPR